MLTVFDSRCWGKYLDPPGLRKLGNGGDCIMRSLKHCINYQTLFAWLNREGRDGFDTCHVWDIGVMHAGQWWGETCVNGFTWKPWCRRKDNIKTEIQETEMGRWQNDMTQDRAFLSTIIKHLFLFDIIWIEYRDILYLHNKNQPDAHYFLIYFSKYPLHVSNRVIIHHQGQFTVHAVYGIYLASTLTNC